MFGNEGLTPGALRSRHRRPTPAFDLMETAGVPRTHDAALELLSWAGVALSLVLTTGVVHWAALPAALWQGWHSFTPGGCHSMEYTIWTTQYVHRRHIPHRPYRLSCHQLSRVLTTAQNNVREVKSAAANPTLRGLYLSLVNLEARAVIGYGWEWETLEVGLCTS
jgi:hypothetical protein